MKYKTLMKALEKFHRAEGDDVCTVVGLLGDLNGMSVDLAEYPNLRKENLKNLKAYIEVLEFNGVQYLISDWEKVRAKLLEGAK